MTILSGEVHEFEGLDDSLDELNIKPKELFEVLSDEDKETVVEEYNAICSDWNEEPVDSVSELPCFVYNEWREWLTFRHTDNLVLDVLRERDQEYVHLSDSSQFSSTFHTIVEVRR